MRPRYGCIRSDSRSNRVSLSGTVVQEITRRIEFRRSSLDSFQSKVVKLLRMSAIILWLFSFFFFSHVIFEVVTCRWFRKFFSLRYAGLWNALSAEVVACENIETMKRDLALHLRGLLFHYT